MAVPVLRWIGELSQRLIGFPAESKSVRDIFDLGKLDILMIGNEDSEKAEQAIKIVQDYVESFKTGNEELVQDHAWADEYIDPDRCVWEDCPIAATVSGIRRRLIGRCHFPMRVALDMGGRIGAF